MKKILFIICSVIIPATVLGQNFNKYLANARSSYSAGKLEDSRFAMEQMLQELDITIGKEVLKKLPAKMESMNANTANDNVTGTNGFMGVLIHRDYGPAIEKVSVDLITNSPLIASINAILSIPFVGNSADDSQKRVKLEGYKGLLQKNTDTETKKTTFELQVPFNSTLLTIKMDNKDEAEVMKMAALIPVSEIAKMLQ